MGATIVAAFRDGWQFIIHIRIILDSKSDEGFLLSLYSKPKSLIEKLCGIKPVAPTGSLILQLPQLPPPRQ